MISAFQAILTVHILHNFDGKSGYYFNNKFYMWHSFILLTFYQGEMHCHEFFIK